MANTHKCKNCVKLSNRIRDNINKAQKVSKTLKRLINLIERDIRLTKVLKDQSRNAAQSAKNQIFHK